jgi:hypothetical protein
MSGWGDPEHGECLTRAAADGPRIAAPRRARGAPEERAETTPLERFALAALAPSRHAELARRLDASRTAFSDRLGEFFEALPDIVEEERELLADAVAERVSESVGVATAHVRRAAMWMAVAHKPYLTTREAAIYCLGADPARTARRHPATYGIDRRCRSSTRPRRCSAGPPLRAGNETTTGCGFADTH